MHVDAEPLDRLRERTSAKWRLFPPDVLPLFVAEMDYPLAAPIIRVLQERIAALEAEIARSRTAIDGKSSQRNAADAMFNFRP